MERKYRRALNSLQKVEGAALSELIQDDPSTSLFLLNVAYSGVGGVTRSQLENALKKIPGVANIQMKNGKPFTLLHFDSISNSKHLRNLWNRQFVEELNKVVFVEYCRSSACIGSFLDIPGLFIEPQFLTEEEEEELLLHISEESHWKQVNGRWVYSDNSATCESRFPTFPKYLQFVLSKWDLLPPNFRKKLEDYNQLTIQKYPIGTGIPSHIDSTQTFGETIMSLSLKSDTVMDFKCINAKSGTSQEIQVSIPRRSLFLLSEDARYQWEHGIKERKSDNGLIRGERISLTFRRVLFTGT